MAVPFDKIKAPSKLSGIFSLRIETITGALHWFPSGLKHPQQSISIQSNDIITMTMILDIEVEFCFLTSTERISRCRKQEKVRPAPACSFVLPQKTSPKFYPGRIRSDVCGMPGTPSPSCLLEAPQKGWLKWNATTVLRDNLGWWSAISGGPSRRDLEGRVLFVGYPLWLWQEMLDMTWTVCVFWVFGSFFFGGELLCQDTTLFFPQEPADLPLKNLSVSRSAANFNCSAHSFGKSNLVMSGSAVFFSVSLNHTKVHGKVVYHDLYILTIVEYINISLKL